MKRFKNTSSSATQSQESFWNTKAFSHTCFGLAIIVAVLGITLTTLSFNSMIDAGISIQSGPDLEYGVITLVSGILVCLLGGAGSIRYSDDTSGSAIFSLLSILSFTLVSLLISLGASSIYSAAVHNSEEVMAERLKDLGYDSVTFDPKTSYERIEEAHENTPGYKKSDYYEQVAYFEEDGKQHYMVVGFDKDKKPFIQSVTEMDASPTKLVNK